MRFAGSTLRLLMLALAAGAPVLSSGPASAFKVEKWQLYTQREAETADHQAGEMVQDPDASEERAWRAEPDAAEQYIMLGSKIQLAPGVYRVRFRLKLPGAAEGPVVFLDVYDEKGSHLPGLTVRAKDFVQTGRYQSFAFDFPWEHSDRLLEFRCQKLGAAPVVLDRFEVSRRSVLLEGGFHSDPPAEGGQYPASVGFRARVAVEAPDIDPSLRVRITNKGKSTETTAPDPDAKMLDLANLSGMAGAVSVRLQAIDQNGKELAEWTGVRTLTVPQPARLAQVIPIEFVQNPDHTYYFVRVGDLDNDGQLDYLISRGAVQQEAHAHDGRLLWKYSDPKASFKDLRGDSDVRIYDLDGDGRNEAILARWIDGHLRLCLVDGATGKLKRSVPYPGFDKKHDNRSSMVIANLSGASRPSNLLVSWDYAYVAALDSDLNTIWEGPPNQGQHTLKVADIDGDGKDEIMCSAVLLDDTGKTIWSQYELPQIRSVSSGAFKRDDVDSPVIADFDANPANGLEVFLSTGGWLLGRDGEVRWGLGEQVFHGQHAEAGPVFPGGRLGIIDVDWRDRGMWAAPRAVILLDGDGKVAWTLESEWATLGDWDGDGLMEVFLGDGRIVDYRGRTLGYTPDFFSNAVSCDVLGDKRDELIVVRVDGPRRQAEIQVYSNAAANLHQSTRSIPRKRTVSRRILNWTCY